MNKSSLFKGIVNGSFPNLSVNNNIPKLNESSLNSSYFKFSE